jgi:pantothenate kinase-related protein Tda10
MPALDARARTGSRKGTPSQQKASALDPFLRSVKVLRDDVPSFKTYPLSIPAVHALHEIEIHPRVTYFVGGNGSGKSTLASAAWARCQASNAREKCQPEDCGAFVLGSRL